MMGRPEPNRFEYILSYYLTGKHGVESNVGFCLVSGKTGTDLFSSKLNLELAPPI